MTEPLFPAQLVATEYAAEDTLSFILRPLDDRLARSVDPGSHIDLHLPNEMMRSYSLSNGPDEHRGYRLTVARDLNSRGGSVYMHEQIRVGQILEISKPRNNFRLDEAADLSVFIAGGIGITPFVPMISRLNHLKRSWQLIYCTRNPQRAALMPELEKLASTGTGLIHTHHDDADGILDLAHEVATISTDAHIYCCGPIGMLDAFRKFAQEAKFRSEQVHFEYFSSNVQSAAAGGFTLALSRSGREIVVEAGETILQALIRNRVSVNYSCEEGICGACETRVVDGLPDHRDMILSDKEKAENKTMMICCSGSKSDRITLDL